MGNNSPTDNKAKGFSFLLVRLLRQFITERLMNDTMMISELTLHHRTLHLHRFPKKDKETLQAWDAGDEYIINYMEELNLSAQKNVLILNDNFGALSCWFSQNHNVTMMSDSFISHQATRANIASNQCNEIRILNTMDEIPNKVDVVLIQLPKNNRHLIWQLNQLRKALKPAVPVIAVNKARDIHTSTLKLFEKHLGQTQTSLAWKKHRLIFSQANSSTPIEHREYTGWNVPEHDIYLDNLPNVYSGESLDIGARFMLEHLPVETKIKHVIDLGCGNGVLAIKMARLNPGIKLTCVDESFMAIASAKRNLAQNLTEEHDIDLIANNCLDDVNIKNVDVILCNPPFHQQQTITDHIAWQMFCDAKQILKPGGQLLVIGNRHLGYDGKLSRLFGKRNVSVVASNKKFVILQASK